MPSPRNPRRFVGHEGCARRASHHSCGQASRPIRGGLAPNGRTGFGPAAEAIGDAYESGVSAGARDGERCDPAAGGNRTDRGGRGDGTRCRGGSSREVGVPFLHPFRTENLFAHVLVAQEPEDIAELAVEPENLMPDERHAAFHPLVSVGFDAEVIHDLHATSWAHRHAVHRTHLRTTLRASGPRSVSRWMGNRWLTNVEAWPS